MKTLIKKEIRLLLPAWIAAMVLAIVPPWILPDYIWGRTTGTLVQVLFSLGVLILGITSFGQEFNSGAISNLLTQPLDRSRIWGTKTTLLSVAFLLVCSAGFASRFQAGCLLGGPGLDTTEGLALAAIVTFSGGLWTTLLLRQMTGAFWFTLLIPAAIVMLVTAALQVSVLSDSSANRIIVVFLAAYSIAGFFFARHLFLRAQDVQWTGGQIAFFSRGKGLQSTAISATRHPRHWISCLFWKEIHLHQISLLFAAFLLPVNIVCFCILKIHPRFNNPNFTSALEAVGILWLLMPLVIGSTAIAEERRMGTLDSHLCLPISRRAQLFVKCLVALTLSLFLGGAIPLFMNSGDHPDFWIFSIAAATFVVSFYTSSFARSTVQAIGVAIVIWVMIGVLLCSQITLFPPIGMLMLSPYLGSWGISMLGSLILTVYVDLTILLPVFGILTFRNFYWLHENQKVWRGNVISVLFAFAGVFAFSHGIYYRAWELFLPIQPPPGLARIESSAQLQLANNSETTLYIVTPAGRLWIETLGYESLKNFDETRIVLSKEESRNEFIGGSNWVDVAGDNFQAVGVQSNGTLWSIQRRWNTLQSSRQQNGPFTLVKIGPETGWSQAAGDATGFLLLKKDGSLWTWGTRNYAWNHEPMIPQTLKLDRTESPVHIGGRESFGEVFSSRGQAYARKSDGTVWRWTGWNDTNYVCTLTHDTNLDNQWSNVAVRSTRDGYSILGVKTNGTLFVGDTMGPAAKGFNSRYQMAQVGQDARWRVAAYGLYSRIWAIRDDGTLWQWATPWQVLKDRKMNPIQLGNRSDWVALTGNFMAGAALAADGSLWAWGQPSRHIWLAPSRKPVYLGNIFETTPLKTL